MSTITTGLAFKEYDAKAEGWPDNPHVFDNNYVIEVKRSDGQGLTYVEAITVISQFSINEALGRTKKQKTD